MGAPAAYDRAIAAARGPWAGREGQLDAPYWSSPAEVVEAMLDLGEVSAGDRLIDLGCGDGRIVVAAAARGADALGVDLDAERIAEARAAARRAGLGSRARFRREDLFVTDVREASVVTLYLVPHCHALLRERLLAELRPGSRVVAHAFPLGPWPAEARADVGRRPIFAWRVPER